jgi:hypothetical protein
MLSIISREDRYSEVPYNGEYVQGELKSLIVNDTL